MEMGLEVSVSYDKIRIVFLLFWYIIFIVPFHTFYFCKMLIQFSWDDVQGSAVGVSLSNHECIVLRFFSTRSGGTDVLINHFSASS